MIFRLRLSHLRIQPDIAGSEIGVRHFYLSDLCWSLPATCINFLKPNQMFYSNKSLSTSIYLNNHELAFDLEVQCPASRTCHIFSDFPEMTVFVLIFLAAYSHVCIPQLEWVRILRKQQSILLCFMIWVKPGQKTSADVGIWKFTLQLWLSLMKVGSLPCLIASNTVLNQDFSRFVSQSWWGPSKSPKNTCAASAFCLYSETTMTTVLLLSGSSLP